LTWLAKFLINALEKLEKIPDYEAQVTRYVVVVAASMMLLTAHRLAGLPRNRRGISHG
jgi:hypothetical protein